MWASIFGISKRCQTSRRPQPPCFCSHRFEGCCWWRWLPVLAYNIYCPEYDDCDNRPTSATPEPRCPRLSPWIASLSTVTRQSEEQTMFLAWCFWTAGQTACHFRKHLIRLQCFEREFRGELRGVSVFVHQYWEIMIGRIYVHDINDFDSKFLWNLVARRWNLE